MTTRTNRFPSVVASVGTFIERRVTNSFSAMCITLFVITLPLTLPLALISARVAPVPTSKLARRLVEKMSQLRKNLQGLNQE